MSDEKKTTGRGGARAGAGRKPSKEAFVSITFRMPERVANQLKLMAKDAGIPRWRVIEDLLGYYNRLPGE